MPSFLFFPGHPASLPFPKARARDKPGSAQNVSDMTFL